MNEQDFQSFLVIAGALASGTWLGNFLAGFFNAEQLGHRLAKWLFRRS